MINIVKTYSLKKDGNMKLSKNFTVKEFRCKDGSDTILISMSTVGILQAVCDYFGQPITITSAYRTPSHNASVGGASASQHVKGTACDIQVANVPPAAVAAFIEKFFPITGCGLYSTFVHVDTRGYKSRWKDITSYVVVNGFNLGNLYEQYKAKEEEEVTQEQFNAMMDKWLSDKAKEDPSEWSEDAREWAIDKGLIQGDGKGNYRFKSFLTREEMVQILYRM